MIGNFSAGILFPKPISYCRNDAKKQGNYLIHHLFPCLFYSIKLIVYTYATLFEVLQVVSLL